MLAVLVSALNSEDSLSYVSQSISHSACENITSHYLSVIKASVLVSALVSLANTVYDIAIRAVIVFMSSGGNDLDGASGSGILPKGQALVCNYAKRVIAIRGQPKLP